MDNVFDLSAFNPGISGYLHTVFLKGGPLVNKLPFWGVL